MDEDNHGGDVVDSFSLTGEALIVPSDDEPADDGWIDTNASKIEFVAPTGSGRGRATEFDKFSILSGLFSIFLSIIASADDQR